MAAAPRPAAAASGSCLPKNQIPVTVLVRSGPKRPFMSLEDGGIAPFVNGDTGRTVVPLRALVTGLAPGSDSIRWYPDLRTATFWYEGHTLSVRFPRGVDVAYTATLDNQSYTLTAYLCDGRVWVNARDVAEAFRIDIQYYEDGVVLIDGAGKDPRATASTRELARCADFPESARDFLASPFAAAEQAATAVACQLLAH